MLLAANRRIPVLHSEQYIALSSLLPFAANLLTSCVSGPRSGEEYKEVGSIDIEGAIIDIKGHTWSEIDPDATALRSRTVST